MIIRIGVEGSRRTILNKAAELGAPILVSANSLWDQQRQRFSGWQSYSQHDTALDSGGFVAMKRYGGYRWTIPQYVALAKVMAPTWWAQMDFCCEPEIAADSAAVWQRIHKTVHHLRECQLVADGEGCPMPVPVLQGWKPADYIRGPIYEQDYPWPTLVGIGSVCRRHVNGPDGIIAVIEALHMKVPAHVQFHLFGVKSQALAKLCTEFPGRIASMDSMAWNMAARWETRHRGGPRDRHLDAQIMADWYARQHGRLDASKSDEQLLLILQGPATQ